MNILQYMLKVLLLSLFLHSVVAEVFQSAGLRTLLMKIHISINSSLNFKTPRVCEQSLHNLITPLDF